MKKSKIIWVSTVFLIAVLLSSCTISRASKIPDISTAYLITIVDNWGGLALAAPINSNYVLENPAHQVGSAPFQGLAMFSVGGYFGDTIRETTQISVPYNVIRTFLRKLSEASPESGEYEPFTGWTDDYPEISIRVLYGNTETLEFYTTSQGKEHVPWRVTYNGKSHVVNSGIPMQALEMLNDYLAQDVLNKLIEQVR
jgi:hypothetical protein